MKCVICRNGETHAGTATVTIERDGATIVVKCVPARVCDNCGEEYLDEDVSSKFRSLAEVAARAGVQVEVRQYAVEEAAT